MLLEYKLLGIILENDFLMCFRLTFPKSLFHIVLSTMHSYLLPLYIFMEEVSEIVYNFMTDERNLDDIQISADALLCLDLSSLGGKFTRKNAFSRVFSSYIRECFSFLRQQLQRLFVMMEFYGFISLFSFLLRRKQKIIFLLSLSFFPSLFRGILYQNQQKYEDAVSSFQKAIHFRPSLACKYHPQPSFHSSRFDPLALCSSRS